MALSNKLAGEEQFRARIRLGDSQSAPSQRIFQGRSVPERIRKYQTGHRDENET